MPDKYDRAIAYLTEFPEAIGDAWSSDGDSPGWPLFQYATPDGKIGARDNRTCGCLTTIRFGHDKDFGSVAWTDELTAAILADERIPRLIGDVTLAHLPVFAEWQRRIDRELGRATEEAI